MINNCHWNLYVRFSVSRGTPPAGGLLEEILRAEKGLHVNDMSQVGYDPVDVVFGGQITDDLQVRFKSFCICNDWGSSTIDGPTSFSDIMFEYM